MNSANYEGCSSLKPLTEALHKTAPFKCAEKHHNLQSDNRQRAISAQSIRTHLIYFSCLWIRRKAPTWKMSFFLHFLLCTFLWHWWVKKKKGSHLLSTMKPDKRANIWRDNLKTSGFSPLFATWCFLFLSFHPCPLLFHQLDLNFIIYLSCGWFNTAVRWKGKGSR